jgi:ankyrin repeat protein
MKWEDEDGDFPKSDDPSPPTLLQDAEGRSALSLARAGDDIEAIARLVQLENDTFQDRTYYCNYSTSLNVAAKEGDLVILDRLLRAKADIFTPGAYCYDNSALTIAAEAGHYEAVKRLLEAERAITSVDGFYSLDTVETAVENGRHDEVARLREAKKILELANDNKCKALKAVASLEDLRIARLLVENGAEANDKEPYSRHHSALTIAAGVGNLVMVEFLLQLNADVSGKAAYGPPEKSPLRAAAEQGHITVVEKLLQSGATIDGTKPLHGAAGSGHAAIVRRLLKAGADIEGGEIWNPYARDKPRRTREHTALQEAALGGHLETMETLLEAGADVHVPAADRGRSALQAAAENGSVDVVRRLLTAGANVNEPASEWGRTSLQAATENGHLEVVEILLGAGAQVETEVAYSKFPAIALASEKGHLSIFRALLDHMNAQNAADTHSVRVNALQKAAGKGHREIVQALLDAGTPAIESDDTYCYGLLGSAVSNGDLEIVKSLLDANVDINYARYPEHNPTSLQIAVRDGRLDIVEALIAAGAEVNTRGSSVPPALHTAAEQGNLEMVQILLESGANVDATSYEGTTVTQAAEKGGKEDILNLLRARTAQTAAETALLEEEWENVCDFPITDKWSLCPACLNLPLELFEYRGSPSKMFDWHPSLTVLQRAAQGRCTFCQFFWWQLGIQEVTLPQPSAIPLYPGMGREGWIQSQISEPHPEDIESPRELFVGFHYIVEPFDGEKDT